MRFSVVTFGSEGDTRPLAALCRGLLDQGHEARLFAERSTLTLASRLGVPCEALAGDVESTLPIADPGQEIGLAALLRAIKAMNALIAANSASWMRAVADHARDSDAILFSSLAVGVGAVLHEELRKPGIGLFFQPITPTREFSSPMLPPMNLPGWANRMTFAPAHRQMWSICGKSAQAARLEIFGTRPQHALRLDFPMLYGVSRHLVPQPRDWPATHRICGHWSRPVDAYDAADDLREFLAAGEPPLYAGFGSPSAFVRKRALQALIDAVAGRRAVFSPGWSRIDSAVLPGNFFVLKQVPHEWLFPRVALAIHHGGAGTTHTAARAGIPQIILPVGADQHFWARRVALRGAAPRYTRNARFKADVLANMIEFAQRDATRHDAAELGNAMSKEDGVGNAIQAITQFSRA